MKLKFYTLLLVLVIFISSCASPGYGTLITASKSPGNYIVNIPQNNEVKFRKEGSGSVVTILWLFSFGDASISSAMEDGNIVKLHHVDNQVISILGLVHVYTIRVYGE
ncbi:MAG: hypothetical protein EPN82_02530 [Bacteroidetes bacterium]|nr:MAG: hypothetical protein EPN82_02530 [Bacteroidota bacterium]